MNWDRTSYAALRQAGSERLLSCSVRGDIQLQFYLVEQILWAGTRLRQRGREGREEGGLPAESFPLELEPAACPLSRPLSRQISLYAVVVPFCSETSLIVLLA